MLAGAQGAHNMRVRHCRRTQAIPRHQSQTPCCPCRVQTCSRRASSSRTAASFSSTNWMRWPPAGPQVLPSSAVFWLFRLDWWFGLSDGSVWIRCPGNPISSPRYCALLPTLLLSCSLFPVEMHEATRRVLGVLLRHLDGFDSTNKRTVVIGATNRKQVGGCKVVGACCAGRVAGLFCAEHAIAPSTHAKPHVGDGNDRPMPLFDLRVKRVTRV